MSTDAPFTPPKKKHNVLWWILGGFLLLVLLFFLQLFGPNPPIVVSKQTTFVTAPLGADGMPDFERYMLEESRRGVTPENNAATLIWAALWPGELDPKDYAAVAKELGLEEIPVQDDALEKVYGGANRERVQKWLQQSGVLPDPGEPGEDFDFASARAAADASGRDVVQEVIDSALRRPWTSDQCPPMAKWVAANQKPLDMLVEASQRPRCYFPSPSLLDTEQDSMVSLLLPAIQAVREAARALSVRAMYRIGEGRADEAWQDLLAIHRIGRLTAQGKTLVEQLVGIAIGGMAQAGALALLDQGQLSREQARQILRDLEALPDYAGIADSLDSGERLFYVDAVIDIAAEKPGALGDSETGAGLSYVNRVSVDWNVVLRKGNAFYDRYAAAARLPTRQARQQAMATINNDLLQLEQNVRTPTVLLGALISRGRRSDLVSGIMAGLLLPALQAASEAQDRANAQLQLLRLAAALAAFRAEHGTYPEKLDDLVPGVLEKLPVDLYNAKPFVYQCADDGYLLYSLGANGVDEGGSNKMISVLRGQETSDLNPDDAEGLESQIPDGADDWSIRLPTRKWEPPKPVADPAK